MKKLKVGVVGTGYLGKFHAEKYACMDHVELIGVADLDKSKADAVAKKESTRAFTDYKELIGKVDAVSIVVPTPDHFTVSRDFLRHDVDVLIEKPITTTLDEAEELIELSENRGRIIQVGHLERFNPAVVALQGIIKQPMFIESHRLSFFKERGIDVSVVLDLMIHDIDIIQSLVKSDVSELHAAGVSVISENLDIANARIEFANGCVANVTASRISAKNQRKIRLFQKDAYISVDFASHDITITRLKDNASKGILNSLEIKNLSFGEGDALKDELASFVQAVTLRKEPEVTGRIGRDALKTALNIMAQITRKNKKHVEQF